MVNLEQLFTKKLKLSRREKKKKEEKKRKKVIAVQLLPRKYDVWPSAYLWCCCKMSQRQNLERYQRGWKALVENKEALREMKVVKTAWMLENMQLRDRKEAIKNG